MDKLAKRAGVATLIMLACAGSAFAFGLYRMASSMESHATPSAAQPRVAAALTMPDIPPPPALDDLPPEVAKPTSARAIVDATKQDLASAFGAALGVDPSKHRAQGTNVPAASPAAAAGPAPDNDDSALLDLGARAERENKLADRDAKSASVRQTGGASQQRKVDKHGEQIAFDVDLTKPR